ncbi:DUF2919 family protein [Alteromonas sp. 5E99-2]|uniref:DUF2919 family protein n=1 Tax=Alteromonas sp. 5E99-2 TaxID=2817683 RepID=UPI001A99FEFF|nr:DUF2919 family protein [Alteromonas sp. 5E99-2]MBO1255506.1 DUF2919 family protein [Alteromonas sp. 5E99-2]
MNKLPLPLRCYNEAGRVVPSTWFTLLFFWGARVLLLLIGTLVLDEGNNLIPKQLFPFSWQLPAHSVLGVVFLGLWLLQGRREAFWNKGYTLTWLRPTVILMLLVDISLQIGAIILTHGTFNLLRGLIVLISLFFLFYTLRSKRTNMMFEDWKTVS